MLPALRRVCWRRDAASSGARFHLQGWMLRRDPRPRSSPHLGLELISCPFAKCALTLATSTSRRHLLWHHFHRSTFGIGAIAASSDELAC